MLIKVVSSRSVAILCFLALFAATQLHGQISLDREPAGPSSRKTALAITEIMYNPRPLAGYPTNETLEFIELFNSNPWDEAIGGYSITGAVAYTFVSNAVLRAGAYLVVARVPGLLLTNYGITNIVGPWDGASTNRLPIDGGTVQLRNRQGAVLLQVDFRDSPPWPEAADGTGHSLVLARPSYGENNFRAWAESDVVGGSPGSADPVPNEPLANLFINEWQNHSDPVDWIELYNHGNLPVDLSGAWLTDDPTTNKYRIANGTTIPARGFLSWDQIQLGFELFAGGETIFLWNSNQTRVIDVIDFRGASNNVAQGRYPDGGPNIYGMSTNTRNGPNARPMRYGVGINEIMFNPISGNNDDEYVEIYNRGSAPVNISGWEFVVGINYTFPTNALTQNMAPGAYYVIGRNLTNLMGIYTNLSTNVNLLGPYSGTLANGGERLTLAAADYDMVQQGPQIILVKLPVPVSDLEYGDGGKWGNWADGGGSSLELIDPEADVHFPSSWADSNDTAESLWTDIEFNGPTGDTLGSPVNDSLIINLEGVGECLVDEVEVRVDNGPNLVVNGGFESGLDGWTLQGSHDFSTVESEGFTGSKSLHVRAASRGDNQSNRILSAPFANPIPAGATNVSLRAKVRWLRGLPELMLRLHGSATEAYGRMSLPRRLGSPGQANSRRVANAGPTISDVTHTPPLPAANQPVVVTAHATDPQNPITLTLRYRIDPAPAYTGLIMRDDGTGGDAVANDGIFSATLVGQPADTLVAFYIEGRDNLNAIATFPADVFPPPGLTRCWPTDALARECLVRWGEVQMPGDFATYHLWLSSVNSNYWHLRAPMNNTPMDGTFVYNNSRVVYEALPLFSGSPFHRTNSTSGPAGSNRVDYVMNFPEDDEFLGTTDFVLVNPGNPDRLTISDLSALGEQTVYKIFDDLGLPNNRRRYIHFFVNGIQRNMAHERPGLFIMEDAQQPNGDMIAEWFPNDAGGNLYKVEDWFEFSNNGFDPEIYDDADLERHTVLLNGQATFLPGAYRFKFRKRSVNVGNSANDYTQIYALVEAASPADNPTNSVIDPDAFGAVADWEAWMRHFAVQRSVGNFDSYGWDRGKNDYLYQGAAGGFIHMPWDIDYSLGLGRPSNEPLLASNDPRVRAMFNTPAIVRAYWRAFFDLVNGPFNNTVLDPFIDARVAALTANNINIDLNAVAAIKAYIHDRRAYLQSQLATVATTFAVAGPLTFSTNNNLIEIRGTAPVNVKTILLNGASYPIFWTSVTNFTLRFVLGAGTNTLTMQGFDRFGAVIPAATISLNVNYTGPVPNPIGSLVIAEIMYRPALPGGQFIEIVNRSAQNFDLSGWRVDGANLTFPAGSIVTNNQRLLLARDRSAFRQAYTNLPVFAAFGATLSALGQAIMLVRPGAFGDELIDGLYYESGPPWPRSVAGASLQLIDPTRDNSRPSNWAIDAMGLATPGAPNSVAATLPAYDPLWLNEVQIESLTGPVDNMGEAEPWIELYNSGLTPLNLDGYFLATNYTSNLTQFPFPPGTVIAPGEYKLFWADGQPEQSSDTNLHTAFRLDTFGSLALVRLVGGQPQVTDYLTWQQLNLNVSYGAAPDGQLIRHVELHTPSPWTTNVEPALRVFINEWMARNSSGIRDPADNAQDDWFELYNAESRPVDLGGLYLTDDETFSTKFRIPSNGRYVIQPGGFLVVFADGQTNQNSLARSNLHVNFQLASSAGLISLFAPDGMTPVDSISYLQQTIDVSEGRYSDGASARYSMTKSTPSSGNSLFPTINSAPKFPPLPTQFVVPGQIMTINIKVADPEIPPQTVVYSIDAGPPGSLLNQGGLYRWVVPAAQPTGDNLVTLRATDSGIPARYDVRSFTITVRAPGTGPTLSPVIHAFSAAAGQATFYFETIPGRTYRVLYKDDLSAASWTQLDRDFVAANTTGSISDFISAPRRFYQVLQLN